MLSEKRIVASAARTVSGNSGSVSTLPNALGSPVGTVPGATPSARFFLSVTAVSGTTPTLDVAIYGIIGGTICFLGVLAQVTAVNQGTIVIDHVPENVQIFWTIGGTNPSFTFSIDVLRSPW